MKLVVEVSQEREEAIMSPADPMNLNTLNWLLEAENPGVRYLTLRDLCGLAADDPELVKARHAAHTEGPIAEILSHMEPEGYWCEPGPGYNPKYFSTAWSVLHLAQLGARMDEDERLCAACAYLLDHSMAKGGKFTITGAPSGTSDCLQGNFCWALQELGCDDPRLQTAIEWMARTVTGEGIAPLEDKKAEDRYYAGKCGPNFGCGANNKEACAWGAVKVVLALGSIPAEKRTPLVQQALQIGIDFLFSVDPATAEYPSPTTGKPSGSWWKFGFPVFYVTDILQIAEALVLVGRANDPRLLHTLEVIEAKRNAQGRWAMEYDLSGKTWIDYGTKKQPNKWVTYRAMKVLKGSM